MESETHPKNTMVRIGSAQIEVSATHIYLDSNLASTYDYVPWNIIGKILADANLPNPHLLDIGANVGDSLAHFRRFSDAPVTCVEPSDEFFEILQRNAAQFQNVALLKKLMSPPDLVGKLRFVSGSQTGFSAIAEKPEAAFQGDHVTFGEVLTDPQASYIVKSDTDGFDEQILRAMIEFLVTSRVRVPVFFFEGPSAEQMQAGDLDGWLQIFWAAQAQKYDLLLLSNVGVPYIYAGQNPDIVRAAFSALEIGYAADRALCHYYDIIGVAEGVASECHKLTQLWNKSMYSQA